ALILLPGSGPYLIGAGRALVALAGAIAVAFGHPYPDEDSDLDPEDVSRPAPELEEVGMTLQPDDSVKQSASAPRKARFIGELPAGVRRQRGPQPALSRAVASASRGTT